MSCQAVRQDVRRETRIAIGLPSTRPRASRSPRARSISPTKRTCLAARSPSLVRSSARSMAPYSLVINIPFPLLVSDAAASSRSDTSLPREIGCWIGQAASFGAGLPGRLPPGHSGRSGLPYSPAPPFTCWSKKATERRIAAPKLAETLWLSPGTRTGPTSARLPGADHGGSGTTPRAPTGRR